MSTEPAKPLPAQELQAAIEHNKFRTKHFAEKREASTRPEEIEGYQMTLRELNHEARLLATIAERGREIAALKTENQKLERVALVAAMCTIDLSSNAVSANKEYMDGTLPHGALLYVMNRQSQMHQALHEAGFTEKHPILEFPCRPKASAEPAAEVSLSRAEKALKAAQSKGFDAVIAWPGGGYEFSNERPKFGDVVAASMLIASMALDIINEGLAAGATFPELGDWE